MEKLYFVMPAYNEEENITETILQWYPLVEKINQSGDFHAVLVIADDGSKDSTLQIMNTIKKEKVLSNFIPLTKQNGGYGKTLIFLYHYALKEGADYIFQTDSDGQTNPNEFWQFFENRHSCDFQIGLRYNRKDGMSRVFTAKVMRILLFLIFHIWIEDANTPFRLMKSNKLQFLLENIPNDFFLCNVAITVFAKKMGYNIHYIPIAFAPRHKGVNSINPKRIVKIGIKAIPEFFKLNSSINTTIKKIHDKL